MSPIRRGMATVVLATLPLAVHAGSLYGTVRNQQGPMNGVKVQIACPGFDAAARSADMISDGSGSYALRVPGSGKCQMRMQQGNVVGPPFDVYLSESPIRLDLVLGPRLERLR